MKISINPNFIVTGGLAALLLLAAAGCSTPPEAPAPEPAKASPAVDPTASTPSPYTNANGEVVCPVMGTVIKDTKDAVGFQDYNGKRYYFCCDGCPDLFKADPTKYKDGKPKA